MRAAVRHIDRERCQLPQSPRPPFAFDDIARDQNGPQVPAARTLYIACHQPVRYGERANDSADFAVRANRTDNGVGGYVHLTGANYCRAAARLSPKISHAAMNIAAITGPTIKPLIPSTLSPPSVEMSTT